MIRGRPGTCCARPTARALLAEAAGRLDEARAVLREAAERLERVRESSSERATRCSGSAAVDDAAAMREGSAIFARFGASPVLAQCCLMGQQQV